jgi:hypothetical protein
LIDPNDFARFEFKLMEDRWMNEYYFKRDEWNKERELLNDDPINWSKTLK